VSRTEQLPDNQRRVRTSQTTGYIRLRVVPREPRMDHVSTKKEARDE
jgi:hypothetical protein